MGKREKRKKEEERGASQIGEDGIRRGIREKRRKRETKRMKR